MKLAIRLRNFCKVNMIQLNELSQAKGKLMKAFRQQFVRNAIDSGDGDYKSVAEVLSVDYRLVRNEYYAPLYLNDAQYRFEVVQHKLLVCNHNHQMAQKKVNATIGNKQVHLDASYFEKLYREVHHWSNRVSELQQIKRNILNGEPTHGKVVEVLEESKLPNNIHPIN